MILFEPFHFLGLTDIKLAIMLNNMDLNSKDSFYPQFENCNNSSLGMENSSRKDNQEMFADAERGTPAQFTHGEFALPATRHMQRLCNLYPLSSDNKLILFSLIQLSKRVCVHSVMRF